MLLYFFVLGIIVLQNLYFKNFVRRHKGRMYAWVNGELISFLCLFYFILGSHRIFETIPVLGGSATISDIFSLCLYLMGIAVFHFSLTYIHHRSSEAARQSRWSTAILELRMLIPFALPFLIFTFLYDLIKFYPNRHFQEIVQKSQETPLGILLTVIGSIFFIFLVMVLLPPIIQWFWQCKKLEKGPMLDKINHLCEKAHFKNAGIKTWGIMNQSLTAAIIGILPRFRYIIFTKRLLREMEPEWIEAVLTHEIGHNYRRHLVIYPFIIFGMILCTGLFSLFFSEGIVTFFNRELEREQSPIWLTLYPFTIFIPYAIIIMLYFRYIFGFFSRLFERQADLHVFTLGTPPEHMISALNYIGNATGTRNDPNWHHYSIQQRVDFLEKASTDHSEITKHHRKVRNSLILYFTWLSLVTFIFLAPLFPDSSPFKQINSMTRMISIRISNFMNKSLPD